MSGPHPKRIETVGSYSLTIHMAGDYHVARNVVREFCDEEGLCVTISPTSYIYTGGHEEGIRVGLINYPRFPKTPAELRVIATRLAYRLRGALLQDSFTIEAPDNTTWFSWREEDTQ